MPLSYRVARCPASARISAGVRVTLAPGVLAVALAGALGAQVTSNGAEFQVNTFTPNSQEVPSVAADGQGN